MEAGGGGKFQEAIRSATIQESIYKFTNSTCHNITVELTNNAVKAVNDIFHQGAKLAKLTMKCTGKPDRLRHNKTN